MTFGRSLDEQCPYGNCALQARETFQRQLFKSTLDCSRRRARLPQPLPEASRENRQYDGAARGTASRPLHWGMWQRQGRTRVRKAKSEFEDTHSRRVAAIGPSNRHYQDQR